MTNKDGVAKLIYMLMRAHFQPLLRSFLLLGSIVSSAIAAPPEVRVGMGLTKPPYVFESGKEGIEVEIAEQAFAVAGYKMVGLQFPPARGLAMQRAGQLDVLLTVDEGIGGTGCYSAPYIVYQNVAFSLASRNFQIKSVEDLANYSVAAFQNAEVSVYDAIPKKYANQ
jgi:polar amino acid transport system substrate-binding protein